MAQRYLSTRHVKLSVSQTLPTSRCQSSWITTCANFLSICEAFSLCLCMCASQYGSSLKSFLLVCFTVRINLHVDCTRASEECGGSGGVCVCVCRFVHVCVRAPLWLATSAVLLRWASIESETTESCAQLSVVANCVFLSSTLSPPLHASPLLRTRDSSSSSCYFSYHFVANKEAFRIITDSVDCVLKHLCGRDVAVNVGCCHGNFHRCGLPFGKISESTGVTVWT